MDKTLYNYYLREMAWLERAGRDFAEANPGLDTFLHGGQSVADPHVDRILEAVAFLAARLDKKLDDSVMQIADHMLQLLYPGLMEPQPSLVIAECRIRKPQRRPILLKRGAQLVSQSKRVRPGEQIRLELREDVEVADLKVVGVERPASEDASRRVLRLILGPSTNVPLAEGMGLPARIPIQLTWKNLADACLMRWNLAPGGRVKVFARTDAGDERPLSVTPTLNFPRPGSLPPALPQHADLFPGIRLLREFFAIPQRFLTVVVEGTGLEKLPSYTQQLVLELPLRAQTHELPICEPRNFRLFPLVLLNLWAGHSRAIFCDGTAEFYDLEPDCPTPARIVSVKTVRALMRGSEKYRTIPRFDYFHREAECYQIRRETVRYSEAKQDERVRLDLRNIGAPGEMVTIVADVDLACPTAPDVLGSRCQLVGYQDVPEGLLVETLQPPTAYVPTPDVESSYWQLIEMTVADMTNIAHRERLVSYLRHLNRTEDEVAGRAIGGIRDVNLSITSTTYRQLPVKLLTMEMLIESQRFLNPGYRELFFDVLHDFIAEQVPLNCLFDLIVKDSESEEILYKWRMEDRTDQGRAQATGS